MRGLGRADLRAYRTDGRSRADRKTFPTVRHIRYTIAAVVIAAASLGPVPSGAIGAPPTPTLPTAIPYDEAVEVKWSLPTGSAAASVDYFKIFWEQGNRSVFVPGNVRSVRFTDLPNGSLATFTVSAHNPAGWGTASASSSGVYPTRPNIVLILTDDQRWDSLVHMPLTMRRAWRRYSQAFVPEPQCCPARASLLSGRLPMNTRVDTLDRGPQFDARSTIATWLASVGYRTFMFGKYLNGYPFGRSAFTPPGWTKFRAFVGTYGYFNYVLQGGGESATLSYGNAESDYSTDRIAELTVNEIRATPRSQPFLAYVAPIAPHWPYIVAPRHANACQYASFPLPSNFNAIDSGGEPPWMSAEPPASPVAEVKKRRATCRMLRSVDDLVDGIIEELTRLGRLANTYIVFTSDNGFHFGEHRLTDKGDLYDEAIRVPLLVRGPDVQLGTSSRLTSNIDLAPTVAEWAGATPPLGVDGRSFASEARGLGPPGPNVVLLRGCRTTPRPSGRSGSCGGYRSAFMNWGVRTNRWKYIEYPNGFVQLFDLASDPSETRNLASDPTKAPIVTFLRATLRNLGGGGPPTIPIP